MDKLIEAKLAMLEAYGEMLGKSKWVNWPDGNQYLVFTWDDFRTLLKPRLDIFDAEKEKPTESPDHAQR